MPGYRIPPRCGWWRAAWRGYVQADLAEAQRDARMQSQREPSVNRQQVFGPSRKQIAPLSQRSAEGTVCGSPARKCRVGVIVPQGRHHH